MRKIECSSSASPNPTRRTLFRADVDQNGDWYVWRQLGANGWATHRRCDSRESALQLADSMNSNSRTNFF